MGRCRRQFFDSPHPHTYVHNEDAFVDLHVGQAPIRKLGVGVVHERGQKATGEAIRLSNLHGDIYGDAEHDGDFDRLEH